MKHRIVLITLLFSNMTFGAIGCMDKSKHATGKHRHAHDKGPDYKTYHYVHCTCPCNKYKKIDERGRCVVCRHFGQHDRGMHLHHENYSTLPEILRPLVNQHRRND